MLPFKLVYHDRYDLRLGAHVFPSEKYRLVRDGLVAKGFADPADILTPEPATDEDLLRVHTPEWIAKLKSNTLTASERMRLEIPCLRETVDAFWLAAGGSILASRSALADGFGINLSGGFHHAFPNHGEGFCMIHDVAVAIRSMQADAAVRKVMVVDTDVHQGNGTAAIFAKDSSVFTLSIHQKNNYPMPKPPSDLDIELEDCTGDDEYLELLRQAVVKSLDAFKPDLLCYVGGADPYREDQLGGLWLSMGGLRRRDELVFGEARRRGIPVMVTLAGGYARNTEDTVRIHMNTVLGARDVSDQRVAAAN
jgi:acetoin utilization deacetylase AcuC-like enzyme